MSGPVWPRPVYACMASGCRYTIGAVAVQPTAPACPAHGTPLAQVLVEPVKPPSGP